MSDLKSLEEKVKITSQNDQESKCQKSETISKMVYKSKAQTLKVRCQEIK